MQAALDQFMLATDVGIGGAGWWAGLGNSEREKCNEERDINETMRMKNTKIN